MVQMRLRDIQSITGRKRMVIVVVLLLIAVLLIGLVAYYMFYKPTTPSATPNNDANKPTVSQNSESTIEAETPEEIKEVESDVNSLVEKAESKDSKDDEYADLMDSYSENGEWQKLLTSARKFDKSAESALSAGWLAYAYEKNSNYAEAAKYYQIAADRSAKSESPEEDSPYNNYLMDKRRMKELYD